MNTVTARLLHLQTKAVLNRLEQGESLVIMRNGRTIGRLEPLACGVALAWKDIMSEVWRAQKSIKAGERVPNPALGERQRRRR